MQVHVSIHNVLFRHHRLLTQRNNFAEERRKILTELPDAESYTSQRIGVAPSQHKRFCLHPQKLGGNDGQMMADEVKHEGPFFLIISRGGDYGQQRERDIMHQISVSEATGPTSSKVTLQRHIPDLFDTIPFFLVQGRDDVAISR